jgi:hypothetical protein
MQEFSPAAVAYYKAHYKSGQKGNYDIYVLFIEQALLRLKSGGKLGYIVPHKFMNAQYGAGVREVVSKGHHLLGVVHFGDAQIFDHATTYTCLLFADNAARDEVQWTRVDDLNAWRIGDKNAATSGVVSADNFSTSEWNVSFGASAALFGKLAVWPTKLADICNRIFQGIKTSSDKIYIVEEREREAGRVKVFSPHSQIEYWLEPGLLHPLIKGGDSRRYHLSRTKRLILFPYVKGTDGRNVLISVSELETSYPLTWAYLSDHRDALEARENGKMCGSNWYGYGRHQALDVMSLPKIFTPDFAARSAFSFDETGEAFFTGGAAGGYGILVKPEHERLYVLGLLNSRLLEWYLRHIATRFRGGYFSYESRFIQHLPIQLIDFNDKQDAARHETMVTYVTQMIQAREQLAGARIDRDRTLYERKVATLERQIDELVYELYGLTDEEKALVENAAP